MHFQRQNRCFQVLKRVIEIFLKLVSNFKEQAKNLNLIFLSTKKTKIVKLSAHVEYLCIIISL
jgi:hypothetical protein